MRSSTTAERETIVVIGSGLVGTSIGQALTRVGHQVHLRDGNPSHTLIASELGAGTARPPAGVESVALVVVAVPPAALAQVVAQALGQYPNAIVTDVGSVKGNIVSSLAEHQHRYVGSHPMAGSHRSGPLAAHPELFRDRTWVVTPHPAAAPAAVARVELLAQECGAAVVTLTVAEHDAAVARVSHLPHLVSGLVAAHLTTIPAGDLRLAGQGLRDVTRVAGSDPQLWQQIVAGNAPALLPELRALSRRLDELVSQLEADPSGGLRDHLEAGVAGTRLLPGKHGQAPVAYAQVVVEIPDQPGILGELFAAVAAAGANIEDLSIEHDPRRNSGRLAISVIPQDAAQLAAAMAAGNWQVEVLEAGDAPS